MINELAAYAQARAGAAARRAATSLIFAAVALVFALFAFAALFAALFFWLEPRHGPAAAALIVAAVAIALSLIALAPLLFRKRPPPPPPTDGMSQFVSLMAQTAPKLGPRQLLAAAAVIALALVLSARTPRR
jgi:hypothetical protein